MVLDLWSLRITEMQKMQFMSWMEKNSAMKELQLNMPEHVLEEDVEVDDFKVALVHDGPVVVEGEEMGLPFVLKTE